MVGEVEWRSQKDGSRVQVVLRSSDEGSMKSSFENLLVYYGQTWVYCNVPTKPLAHWPFLRQTTEQPEVSPEVILDGVVEDSRVLNQVL